MIKIHHRKDFDDLSANELAKLIKSYVSGNEEEFDKDAIYEFIGSIPRRKFVAEVRNSILDIDRRYRSDHEFDGLNSKLGREALTELAQSLELR